MNISKSFSKSLYDFFLQLSFTVNFTLSFSRMKLPGLGQDSSVNHEEISELLF